MSDDTIRIVTYEPSEGNSEIEATEGRKGGVGMDMGVVYWPDDEEDSQANTGKTGDFKLTDVSVQKIEQEMARFMQTMDKLFSRAELQAQMQAMDLAEVELWVSITAEGSVSLIGQGAKLAGTRSVVLRFRKRG
ncbi:hypothetical protein H6G20_08905 [Desertifilum sp. FACHB-1129]|uniref:Pepco domain-containing protein n=1 Tax=Desertifilum tharense IPPAS B-1220 TaxID=1781255 RepID=A0A1E5QHQ1_9CYAN|nr:MULTISPECIES: hypothetical protein [Desertifilum]MDA0209121.1 hypothetical protein [Cyanobacteria bacterium FC1]MBD2311776.1 hypothetical protein [Desertifilum sp. FACHB-1129]MBD2325038.1 hypothetical protein [Desertifilum sp. FACHB-866]MBD2333351.1 hypothetical protein [Desertifilum sp. FACHB-868]OEJ74107.1 hypothetical protein BH720_16225 [Desertifilum tharense IPPAS B-1220]